MCCWDLCLYMFIVCLSACVCVKHQDMLCVYVTVVFQHMFCMCLFSKRCSNYLANAATEHIASSNTQRACSHLACLSALRSNNNKKKEEEEEDESY